MSENAEEKAKPKSEKKEKKTIENNEKKMSIKELAKARNKAIKEQIQITETLSPKPKPKLGPTIQVPVLEWDNPQITKAFNQEVKKQFYAMYQTYMGGFLPEYTQFHKSRRRDSGQLKFNKLPRRPHYQQQGAKYIPAIPDLENMEPKPLNTQAQFITQANAYIPLKGASAIEPQYGINNEAEATMGNNMNANGNFNNFNGLNSPVNEIQQLKLALNQANSRILKLEKTTQDQRIALKKTLEMLDKLLGKQYKVLGEGQQSVQKYLEQF